MELTRESLLIEYENVGLNKVATINFGLNNECKVPEMFTYVKSEIIVDNYFQMEPICTVECGDWPKTRVSISNNIRNSSFIYKGKEGNDSAFHVQEFNSNYELIQYILQVKKYVPSDHGISQEFFTTTTILRHIFKHKQDEIELHVCSLKLSQEMYYTFGKLKQTDKLDENSALLDCLKELTNDEFYNVSMNGPVIQTMLHERNPLLDSIERRKLCQIDNKYASSMSGSIMIIPSIDQNTDLLKLIHIFKYMDCNLKILGHPNGCISQNTCHLCISWG